MRKWLASILFILAIGRITTAQEVRTDTLLEKLDVAIKSPPDTSGETANEDAERFVNNGNRSFSSHDLKAAIANYRKAVELNPNSTLAQRNLGVAYLAAREYRLALGPLTQASVLDPESVEEWNYLGLAYYNLKEFDRAAHCYQRAIQIAPSQPAPHSNLGHTYLHLLRYSEAEAAFNSALRYDAKFSAPALGLCLVHSISRGSSDQTLTSCQKAVELDPNSPSANYLLGYTYLYRREYGAALNCFNQVMKLDGGSGLTYAAVGRVQYHLGNYDEALKNFARAGELEPNLADAHIGKGSVYFGKRKIAEAVREFQRAIEIDPDAVEARFNLGIACLRQENRDCALQQYDYLKILDSSLADRLYRQIFRGRILDVRSTGLYLRLN